MIILRDEDIRKQTKIFFEEVTKGGKAALMFDDFISNTMKSLYGRTVFPSEVKLPKSLEELIDGDFSPSEIIRMPAPFIDDIPIWRGSTLKDNGVVLRGAGYINGDSRKPCNIALDDNVPHGLVAGATGHGKSVTLNSIIVAACIEYAPWEVQFFLVDAKIVEMKAYGVNAHIPHISSIAATSDAEYIISVLEDARNIMMLRNSAFTSAGVKNIKSFREKTGLSMPHIFIPIDEFVSMYRSAKRKAKFINELIVEVANKGRNSGIHLLMASQELGDELDKAAIGSLGTRLCLGCMSNVSTKVLGNDEAKTNFKQKGRLIINNNPAKENNSDENFNMRTPFLPDIKIGDNRTIFDYMKLLSDVGKGAKTTPFYNLSFYDEEARCYEDRFPVLIKGKSKPNMIYLGEPSFVLRAPDGEKWLRLELKEEIGQNILCFTSMLRNRERYISMLSYNLKAIKDQGINIQCKIFYTNKESFRKTDIGLSQKPIYTREFDTTMESAINSAMWRRIMFECDEQAFGDVAINMKDAEIFQTLVNSEHEFDGELWSKRAQVLWNMFNGTYSSRLGFSNITNEDKKRSAMSGNLTSALRLFKGINHEVSRVTIESFVPQYIMILGLEQLSGIGIDGKTSRIDAFKKIINESPEFKVFFILSAASLEDCATIRTAITHVICDDITSQMQGHLKIADYFPDTVNPGLGVYYLATAEINKCRKFKKMIYKGEIL